MTFSVLRLLWLCVSLDAQQILARRYIDSITSILAGCYENVNRSYVVQLTLSSRMW